MGSRQMYRIDRQWPQSHLGRETRESRGRADRVKADVVTQIWEQSAWVRQRRGTVIANPMSKSFSPFQTSNKSSFRKRHAATVTDHQVVQDPDVH
jgi:hypothetical protein